MTTAQENQKKENEGSNQKQSLKEVFHNLRLAVVNTDGPVVMKMSSAGPDQSELTDKTTHVEGNDF